MTQIIGAPILSCCTICVKGTHFLQTYTCEGHGNFLACVCKRILNAILDRIFALALALQLLSVLLKPIFVCKLLTFGEGHCAAYIVRNRTGVRPVCDTQSGIGNPTPEGNEKHHNKMQVITAMFVVCRHDLRASELERGYYSGSYQLKPREGPGRT